jgi:hypothetical protein
MSATQFGAGQALAAGSKACVSAQRVWHTSWSGETEARLGPTKSAWMLARGACKYMTPFGRARNRAGPTSPIRTGKIDLASDELRVSEWCRSRCRRDRGEALLPASDARASMGQERTRAYAPGRNTRAAETVRLAAIAVMSNLSHQTLHKIIPGVT